MAVRRAAVLKAPRKARPVKAGATAQSAARAALRESLEQIAANLPGAGAGSDPEYLHQLRVGTRRLRAALRVFRALLRRSDMGTLRRRLRRLARVTGPARDWDVHAERLPSSLRPRARTRRLAAHAALRRVLASMPRWAPPRVKRGAPLDLPEFARNALEGLDRKVGRKGARGPWRHAERRHALRIRLRRLRYASEFLAGAFPGRDARPLVGSLKLLQDLLGELNDLAVARRLQSDLTGRRARASGRGARLIAQLPAAWRRFAVAPRFWRDK